MRWIALYNITLLAAICFLCWMLQSGLPCFLILAAASGKCSRGNNDDDDDDDDGDDTDKAPPRPAPTNYADVSVDRGGDTHRPTR